MTQELLSHQHGDMRETPMIVVMRRLYSPLMIGLGRGRGLIFVFSNPVLG